MAVLHAGAGIEGTGLYDHLGDARAAEGLATDEGLTLDAGEQVAEGGNGEDDGGHDQGGGGDGQTEPLDEGHGTVRAGAHVVGRDLADRGIEGGRGRADSQEQRHLNEQDDERRYPRAKERRRSRVSSRPAGKRIATIWTSAMRMTYRQKTPKRMIKGRIRWKKLAIPSAKQRIMDRIPSLS